MSFSPQGDLKTIAATCCDEITAVKQTRTYSAASLVQIALKIFVALSILIYFIPYPVFPTPGLDASWNFVLSEALSQKLIFGKDIIFTYGPYGLIATHLFYPSTYKLMLIGSLFIGVGYSAMLLTIMNQKNDSLWILACSLIFIILPGPHDVVYLLYPFLWALIVYNFLTIKDSLQKDILLKKTNLLIFLTTIPLGLLPLIKGTFLIISAALISLTAIMMCLNKHKKMAASIIIIPVFSMLFFWQLAKQPIFALPHYFLNLVPIMSGYSEAMSTAADSSTIILYLIASLCILMAILLEANSNKKLKTYLFLSTSIFLFIAFKESFTRGDNGHVMAACSVLIFGPLLLIVILKNRYSFIFLILSALIGFFILPNTSRIADFITNFEGIYKMPVLNLELARKNRLLHGYNNALAQIRSSCAVPNLEGSTDIYPYDQSCLFAANLHWAPRPIFQSYSAYTPKLETLNAIHLLSKDAPQNIIFSVKPIDNRLPSLDDGLSWPILLKAYNLSALTPDWVTLKKNGSKYNGHWVLVKVGQYNQYEEVLLPKTRGLLFAQLKMRETILGRIFNILFKTPPVSISVLLANGQPKTFRIIPEMAESQFLISPLIEKTNDFALLYDYKNNSLKGQRVISIAISSSDSKHFFWSREYGLNLYVLSASAT